MDNSEKGLVLITAVIRKYCICGCGARIDDKLDEIRNMHVSTVSEFLESIADVSGSHYKRAFTMTTITEGSARWDVTERSVLKQILIDANNYPDCLPFHAWKQREANRLNTSQYTDIPECIYAQLRFPLFHFPHLPQNTDDLQLIAYIESDEKGRADKQTVMKFGRYLAKYFDFDDARKEALVRMYQAARTPKTYQLMTTTDKSKITEIFETKMYADGGDQPSCMYMVFSSWPGDRPYHVYADSKDVAVAYMVSTLEDDNIIYARSVVNERTKKWIRRYANTTGKAAQILQDKFAGLLKDVGYTKGDLIGCKLTPRYDKRNNLLCPYIDGENDGMTEDFVITADEDYYNVKQASGYPAIRDQYTCDDCNFVSPDGTNFQNVGDQYVCNDCINTHYTDVRTNLWDREFIPNDEAVTDCDGDSYSQRYADVCLTEYNGEYHTSECGHLYTCDECSDTYEQSEGRPQTASNGNVCCPKCFDKLQKTDEIEEGVEQC